MSTSQRVVKNTLFLYLRTIISLLTNVFTTRILLDALGASDYGLYNVVGGSIAMLGFLSASMSSATQRFISHAEGSGDRHRVREIFNNAVIVHYGLAAITCLLLAIGALFFFNGVLNIPAGEELVAVIVYICFVVTTAFSITIVPYDAEINAHENMLFYSILGILDVICKLLIAVAVLYWDSERLIFYSVLMAVESFLLRAAAKWYSRRHYEECRNMELKKYISRKVIKELTTFAGWNMANIATGMISLFGMNIVVNHYFGTTMNAAMGIATQLSGVIMGVSMNMIKAITPVLTKAEGGDRRDKMLEVTYVGCKYSFLLFAFCCVPVMAFMPEILRLWLKDVPPMTAVLAYLALGGAMIDQLTVLLYQTIMAEGHIRGYNITRSVTNIVPIVITILMFQFGSFGVAWALFNWAVWKGVMGGIVNVYFAYRNAGLNVLAYIRRCLFPSTATMVMSVLIFVCMSMLVHSTGLYWILGLAGGVVLSIPVYWRIGISTIERTALLGMVDWRNRIRKGHSL